MLALFNFNRNTFTGWTKLTTAEGVNVLFPQNATRASSVTETPIGPMSCTLYSGRWNNSSAMSILAIREYHSEEPLLPEALFMNWKSDFQDAMEVSGIYKNLVKETVTEGKETRCDLIYSSQGETNFTRVSLIAQGNRLIVLFTVGMLQEVMAPACCECFRSIKV